METPTKIVRLKSDYVLRIEEDNAEVRRIRKLIERWCIANKTFCTIAVVNHQMDDVGPFPCLYVRYGQRHLHGVRRIEGFIMKNPDLKSAFDRDLPA